MEKTEDKQILVTYTFYLPDHQDELKTFSKAGDYSSMLWDIHNRCRTVWKYDDKASDELVTFAEEIGQMCYESGALDN